MSIIDTIHYLMYLLPIAYVFLSNSTKHYDLIIAFFMFVTIHWIFLRDECVMNYFKKKSNDCEYRLGDYLDIPTELHKIIIGILIFITIVYTSYKLKLNIPLVLFATGAPRLIISFNLNDPLRIRRVVAPLVGMYVLRNNQYFIPGMLAILIGSCIIKHKDRTGYCLKK